MSDEELKAFRDAVKRVAELQAALDYIVEAITQAGGVLHQTAYDPGQCGGYYITFE